MVLTQNTVSSPAAARAVAPSASPQARPWKAIGATSTGQLVGRPSTVVARERRPTSTSTRGRSGRRSNARRFSRRVRSSPDPPLKYRHAIGSSAAAAARSTSHRLRSRSSVSTG
jgi:hypothetical protein